MKLRKLMKLIGSGFGAVVAAWFAVAVWIAVDRALYEREFRRRQRIEDAKSQLRREEDRRMTEAERHDRPISSPQK